MTAVQMELLKVATMAAKTAAVTAFDSAHRLAVGKVVRRDMLKVAWTVGVMAAMMAGLWEQH